MSASDPDSKIDILDTADAVRKKLRKAFAAPGEVEGNGLISFVEYVLLPLSALQSDDGKGNFTIERNEGEALVYHDIETIKSDYKAEKLTPQLLKAGATSALVDLLAPIQAEFQASSQWQDIEKKAYPPAEPAKKKKQPKNRGSKYPGPGSIKAQPDGSIEGKNTQQAEVGKSAEEAMAKLAVNGEHA